jgi:hypothetical protein
MTTTLDDVTEGGKKVTMRKWKEVTMILTSSHLLFFRDPAVAADFSTQTHFGSSIVFAQPTTLLKPDEMVPLKDGVALFDASYRKVSFGLLCINERILICALP